MIASAAFPVFDRNLNTGGNNETETKYVKAEQTIYHDALRPSHIILPGFPSARHRSLPRGGKWQGCQIPPSRLQSERGAEIVTVRKELAIEYEEYFEAHRGSLEATSGGSWRRNAKGRTAADQSEAFSFSALADSVIRIVARNGLWEIAPDKSACVRTTPPRHELAVKQHYRPTRFFLQSHDFRVIHLELNARTRSARSRSRYRPESRIRGG
jgi:hypothetical protein